MKKYENVRVDILVIDSLDVISTSGPLDGSGTETSIVPEIIQDNLSVTDSTGVASNY